MNKKGFTLIELIVSIVLVGIVLASMIGTLMSLKETYTVLNDDIEARTYSALVSKTINDHIMKNNGIKGYTCVANRCEMILGSFDSNGQNKVMTLEITTSTVKTSPMKDKNTTIGSLMEKATTVKYYGEGYSYYKTIKHYDRHYNDSNKDVETGYKFENIEEKSSLYEGNTPEDLKDYLVNITIKMNNPKYNIEIYSTSQVAKVESENLRLYTLTYNSNGGSTCPNNPKVGADRKPWGELCKPTRPNYGFEGWFIQQDGISVREITASTIALEDITVYAHWDNNRYSCPAGEYLPAGSKTCAECLEDNYCPGITDKYYDKFNDQGIIPCKSGYHSPKGSSVETSCKITCPEGTYLNVANDASCTNCPKGYQKGGHQVSEGQTSRCTLIDPSKPSISGGTTKIYGSADITLTCTTPTEYDNPASVYYSFGYSTTEGGTLGNYSTASNNNTFVISKTEYVGNRYYACRVYAGESGGNSTNTINSDGRTLVKIRNAKITFDKNDGALSGTSPLYTKTGVATLYDGELSSTTASAPTATKTGHDFNGWFTASTNGSKILSNTNAIQSTTVSGYIKSSKWTTTTDKTLYAQFSPHNYTLTFDCNGGSGAPSVATVAYGSKYTLTTSVCSTAKTGYTQDGWNTKSDGSGTTWNTSNTNNWTWNLTDDVTLYAKWKANTYTVTYNANGGTGTMSNSTATYNEDFVTRQNTFTKTGYTFNGWNEKADGTGTVWSLTGTGIYENGNGTHPWKWTYTKDITLYAVWKANTYTVTYNANGGTGTMSNSTATYNENFVTRQNTFTKTGYIFNGWNEKADGTGTVWSLTGTGIYENENGTHPWKWTYTKDITLYAVWKENSYTLTYNSEGGSTCSPATVTKSNGSAWGSLCSPTKTGYKFVEWNTKADGTGTKITSSSTATSNITVHAVWAAKIYTLVRRTENYMKTREAASNFSTYGKSTIEAITNGYRIYTKGVSYGGAQLPSGIFVNGRRYIITYTLKKVSGTLNKIGGHMGSSTQNEFKINGVNSTLTYDNTSSSSTNLTDNFNEYKIFLDITFKTGDRPYIQPNRGSTVDVTADITYLDIYEVISSNTKTYGDAYNYSELNTEIFGDRGILNWYNNNNLSTKLTTSIKFTSSNAIFDDINTENTNAYIFGDVINKANMTLYCILDANKNEGIIFSPKVGATSFGLTTSTTPTYNSASSISTLAAGTYYGYVKDSSGNTSSCSITIISTYAGTCSATPSYSGNCMCTCPRGNGGGAITGGPQRVNGTCSGKENCTCPDGCTWMPPLSPAVACDTASCSTGTLSGDYCYYSCQKCSSGTRISGTNFCKK